MKTLKRSLIFMLALYGIFCIAVGHNVIMAYLFSPEVVTRWITK